MHQSLIQKLPPIDNCLQVKNYFSPGESHCQGNKLLLWVGSMPSNSWPTHREWIGLMSLFIFVVSIKLLAVILMGLPLYVTGFSLLLLLLSRLSSVPLLC